MTHRYAPTSSAPKLRALPFTGLRSAFADGYGPRDLRSDVLAGVVVGVVALPLSMALAIAVGVPPPARPLHGDELGVARPHRLSWFMCLWSAASLRASSGTNSERATRPRRTSNIPTETG